MSLQLGDVDLSHLSEAERDVILGVLERDEHLRDKEIDRVRTLRNEIKALKLKGIIRDGVDAEKTCARCRKPFGWIFNSGSLCPKCQHKVCDQCKVTRDGKWMCNLCQKQHELEAMSGTWFYMKWRKSKRSKKTNKPILGGEIVKSSFKRKHMHMNGTANQVNEEVKRALSNNNAATTAPGAASPSQHRRRRRSNEGGESSDTQSAQHSPARGEHKNRGRPHIDDAAFPRDTDKALLLDLIGAKPMKSSSRPLTPEQTTVEVRKVNSNRYASDSSSEGSISGNSSPQMSLRTDSMFDRSESMRSSLRSNSAQSSDGRMTLVTDNNSVISDISTAPPSMMGGSPSPSNKRPMVGLSPTQQSPSPDVLSSNGGRSSQYTDSGNHSHETSVTGGYSVHVIRRKNSSSSSSSEDFDGQFAGAAASGGKSNANQLAASKGAGKKGSRSPSRSPNKTPEPSPATRKKRDYTGDNESAPSASAATEEDDLVLHSLVTVHATQNADEEESKSIASTTIVRPSTLMVVKTADEQKEVESQSSDSEPTTPVVSSEGLVLSEAATLSSHPIEVNIVEAEPTVKNHDKLEAAVEEQHDKMQAVSIDEKIENDKFDSDGSDKGDRTPNAGRRPQNGATLLSQAAGAPQQQEDARTRSSTNSSVPSISVTTPDTQGPHAADGGHKDVASLRSSEADSTSRRSTNLLSPFSASQESVASFYSEAGEGNYGKVPISGEILFGLDYNYKTTQFEVRIKQCKEIAAVDTKRKRSDPYVKVYLLPDRTKNGKRKTRVKKHSLNPVFDEVLKYTLTKSELETRTLWIAVWHNDTFGRNDFLGEVTMPLDYYEFNDSQPKWYKLQERGAKHQNPTPMSLLTYKGDLTISLKYVTPENVSSTRKIKGRSGNKGELHVLVKQARNLTAIRANGTSDPFCKGYLLPEKSSKSKQKTMVMKKNVNPEWNHTFVFEDVAWEEMRERCLELSIWDHDRFTSNDFLGGVRLGLGTGKSYAKEVDWNDSKGEEISIWQSMLDRPNYWIHGTLLLRPNMDRRK